VHQGTSSADAAIAQATVRAAQTDRTTVLFMSLTKALLGLGGTFPCQSQSFVVDRYATC
jgi:hypothetical protein